MILYGTDIYHGNEIDSFDLIAQSVDWIALKVTEGDNFVDPLYATRVLMFLQRANNPAFRLRYVLSTHWVTPMSANRGSYLDQANWYLAHMDRRTGVMLDSEQAGVTAIGNRQWCNVVEQEVQRNVAIYSGAINTAAGYAGYSIWRDTALFVPGRARILAAYTSEAKARALSAPYSFDAWQFSDNQTISGFPHPVDGDHIYNPSIFDRICGLDQIIIPPSPIIPPPFVIPFTPYNYQEDYRVPNVR